MWEQLFYLLTSRRIQWRSEIWTSLVFEWSIRAWVANGLDFKWDFNLEAQPFEIWTNYHHFVKKNTFEIWTKTSRFWMVQFSNVWDYSYSHCLSPTIWNPTLKKSRFPMFLDFEWMDFRSPLCFTFKQECKSSFLSWLDIKCIKEQHPRAGRNTQHRINNVYHCKHVKYPGSYWSL